jgi:hypothetical protein
MRKVRMLTVASGAILFTALIVNEYATIARQKVRARFDGLLRN